MTGWGEPVPDHARIERAVTAAMIAVAVISLATWRTPAPDAPGDPGPGPRSPTTTTSNAPRGIPDVVSGPWGRRT